MRHAPFLGQIKDNIVILVNNTDDIFFSQEMLSGLGELELGQEILFSMAEKSS